MEIIRPLIHPLTAKKPCKLTFTRLYILKKWSHLGSNQGPPDYESGALTN